MNAAARLGWRVAAILAFGVTAALAVTLTRGAPLPAALVTARHAAAAKGHATSAAPRCTASGLRVSVGPGTQAAAEADSAAARYPPTFTSVSAAPYITRPLPACSGGRNAPGDPSLAAGDARRRSSR